MTRVLITGGAGWIAGLLRAAWAGEDVVAVDRRPADGVVLGDLTHAGPWIELLDGVESVVHLAGVGSATATEAVVWPANVRTTENLLAACSARGVRRVVLASSVWALSGHARGTTVVPGDAAPDPGDNAYGASKAAAEAVLAAWTADHPARTGVALRLGGCVPGGGSPRPAQDAWEDSCWLGQDDCVRAVTAAVRVPEPGYHVATVISLCPRPRWDLAAAERVLGYRPTQRLVLLERSGPGARRHVGPDRSADLP